MKRKDIIEKIKQSVMDRLNSQLPDNLYYHVPAHTLDVYKNVQILAKAEGLSDEEMELLMVAAIYHDIGFIEQYDKNEPIGAKIATEELPEYGFSEEEIRVIYDLIMATQMPHHPKNKMEEIICDADLDNLGREDFYVQTELLRLELKANGIPISPRQWYGESLIKFFEMHSYFTDTAKKEKQPVKEQHLKEILELTGKV